MIFVFIDLMISAEEIGILEKSTHIKTNKQEHFPPSVIFASLPKACIKLKKYAISSTCNQIYSILLLRLYILYRTTTVEQPVNMFVFIVMFSSL